MLRYEAATDADPRTVWPLIARPSRWSEWSPHIRGAWGLGDPEVVLGRRGAIRFLGVVPVPARVTQVDPGRCWSWRVGVVTTVHRVDPVDGGSVVGIDIAAPWPIERAMGATYGPVCEHLVRVIGKVASRDFAAAG